MNAPPRSPLPCATPGIGGPAGLACAARLLRLGLEDEPATPDDSLGNLDPLLAGSSSGLGVQFHTVGRYALQARLARGGMGVVFQAWQTDLQREVALKFLLPAQVGSPDALRRFRTEAEATARLDHPNIVPIYEIGEADERHYLCMKLIRGGTLAGRLSVGKFEPRPAARFMATLAEAVHYAHQRGVLHRDLKPGNILVDEHGEPQVTDFGLARLLEEDRDLTHTGAILGTPAYMSPEQASGGAGELTTASDIYSLGAILHEMLTGTPPFQAGTALETLQQVAQGGVAPLRTRDKTVPRGLDLVCQKCLARHPAARYATAQELADDLRRFLRGEPVQAHRTSPWTRAWLWYRRHPAAGRLLALVLVLLLGFTGASLAERERIVRDNLAFAGFVARGLADNLQAMVGALQEQSRDIAAHLGRHPDAARTPGLTNQLRDAFARLQPGPDSWATLINCVLMDPDGNTMARWPGVTAGRTAVTNRSDRDYCHGALAGFRSNPRFDHHISAVYESREDGLRKIGISVVLPRAGRPDEPQAVLTAMLLVTSPAMARSYRVPHHAVVLLAPRDPGRARQASTGTAADALPAYDLYVHPALGTNHPPVRFSGRPAELTMLRLHFDPAGRVDWRYRSTPWLAGLSPVPSTPFVVLVQSRDWVLLFLVPGLLLTGALLATMARPGSNRVRPDRHTRPPSSTRRLPHPPTSGGPATPPAETEPG